MQRHIVEALKITELEVNFENISHDDKREIDSYTIEEAIKEADYTLSLYYESEHFLNDELRGECGAEAQKEALKQVRMLRRFIKKWSNTLERRGEWKLSTVSTATQKCFCPNLRSMG